VPGGGPHCGEQPIPVIADFLTSYPRFWSWGRWLLEFGFRGEFQLIRKVLDRMGGPVRVLDVGCGTGQMAPAFIGHRYLGVDLEARFLRAAPRHHGFDYAVMDARQLAVPSESVDLVLVSGVLHHLHQDEALATLREIGRVLRTGGISIIMEDRPVSFFQDPVAWVIHKWDLGGQYRSAAEYLVAMPEVLKPIEIGTMRSGFCPYLVLILEKVGRLA
jgi:SAM-dependent methyltransferase